MRRGWHEDKRSLGQGRANAFAIGPPGYADEKLLPVSKTGATAYNGAVFEAKKEISGS